MCNAVLCVLCYVASLFDPAVSRALELGTADSMVAAGGDACDVLCVLHCDVMCWLSDI